MKSKRRLLEAFSRVNYEPLRALTAELVQIRVQHDGENAPISKYKATIDSYAQAHGDSLDVTFSLGSTSAEGSQEEDPVSGEQERMSGQEDYESIVTLESISLDNFGSYYGTHEIELAPLHSRNVTALVGSNGDGKSTVFYALNWALYGDVFLDELRRDKQRQLKELINRRAVMESAESSGQVEASVRLHFSTKGRHYYVVRDVQARVRQSSSGLETIVEREGVRLRRVDANGNHEELLASALSSLIAGLPSHVKEFYLFDGERINRFVAPGAQALIRRAIRRVIGIEDLERTADDLAKVGAQFRSEAKKASSGELTRVQEDLESKTASLARTRAKLETATSDSVTLSSRIDEIDSHLEKTTDTRPLKDRRTKLETQLKELDEQEGRLAYEMRELAADAAIFMAGDAVSRLVGELDARRQIGAIPGPISKQLMRDLLETGKCICGCSLAPGSVHRTTLEKSLEEVDSRAKTSERLLSLFIDLGALDGVSRRQAQALDKRLRDHSRVQKIRRETNLELGTLSEQLEALEDIDRSGWESERKEKRSQLVGIEANILDYRRTIDRLAGEIKTLKTKEAELTKSQAKAKALVTRANWAEGAEEALRLVFSEFAAVARADIEATTTQLWHTMLRTVSQYRVTVGEDFELRVINSVGEPAIQQLSMGQQQCLGLSFITAVAQVAESRPPLIIDMPFGRLGVEVASSVAATLPTLTNQLVLFVLPETEWNDQTRAAIDPYLAREYWIRFNPDTQSTSFVAPA